MNARLDPSQAAPVLSADQALGQIAVQWSGATAVFRRLKLDFCCGGQVPLAHAAEARGLDVQDILAELAALQRSDAVPDSPSAAALIDHILHRYHEVHRQQLPELIRMARRVEAVHREHPDVPAGLADHLETMHEELLSHMAKEEQVLFPLLRAGGHAFVGQPIGVVRAEHTEHGAALERLQALARHHAAAGRMQHLARAVRGHHAAGRRPGATHPPRKQPAVSALRATGQPSWHRRLRQRSLWLPLRWHSRPPMSPATPDLAAITALVNAFYADVQRDPLLGPVFERALHGQWDAHRARLVEFWCTVLLGTRSFRGDVMGRHMALDGITPAHFAAWVRLWQRHTAERFAPDVAERLQQAAHGIARNLFRGYFGAEPPFATAPSSHPHAGD